MSSAANAATVVPPGRVYPERPDVRRDWLERSAAEVAGLALAWSPGLLARALSGIVGRTHAAAAGLPELDDGALRDEARRLGLALRRTGFSQALVARSFAVVRESAGRVLGLSHHDVQLVGGFALLKGAVAEMQTGEGKTLTATLAAATAALAGIPVHVVTVNDYLVERDAGRLGPLYESLGLTVGTVVAGMDRDARRAAYACDVVYCTNKELAFDYLRDQMVLAGRKGNLSLKAESLHRRETRTARLVLRGLCFAIVDEADSVLVDEARTPLVISRDADVQDELERSETALELARSLVEGEDYAIRSDGASVEISRRGKARLAALTEDLEGVWTIPILQEELVTQALAALHLFHRDRQYLVEDGTVEIIDEYTGRVMADRSWSEGLHQLIEVKEGCEPSARRVTLSRITYQRLFRRFERLAGMTGTASEVARELWTVFGLAVVRVPTHRPCRRATAPVRIVGTVGEKWSAVAARAGELQAAGAAVLVGTRSVAASEELGAVLTAAGLEHVVLNATQVRQEAEIVARAGQAGRITVATNMAGRGTDIVLGPGVAEKGGLHVIASERHDAGRIDRQLAGRSARQGDPGSAEAFLSLQDPLVEFAAKTALGSALVSLARLAPTMAGPVLFARAQRRAERVHWRMRKDLLMLDERLGEALAFSGRAE